LTTDEFKQFSVIR